MAAAAVGLGAALLRGFPTLELEVFARAAASLGGLFLGVPVQRVESGWLLPTPGVPAVVTTACSATDYFLLVAAFLVWRGVRRGGGVLAALAFGLVAALPLTLTINAARIVVVVQAHRWVIPRLPAAYGPFLHLLTGVLVFLPALVVLSLVLEAYERSRPIPR
jgi:exosortase/archaeosortase family protein